MDAGTNRKHRCHGQVMVTDSGVRGLRDFTTDQLAILVKAALREYAGRFPGGRDIPLPDGVSIVTTTELSIAAYWDRHGVPLIAVRPNSDRRAGYHQSAEFVHADYNGAANRQAAAYVSSESAEQIERERTLKKEAIRVRDLNRNIR